MDARPEVSEYGSVDPAPASESEQLDQLRNTLLDENEKMFQRMRSVFKLRNIRTPQSCLAQRRRHHCKPNVAKEAKEG